MVIDAREFVDKTTGIGQFLEGLSIALCSSDLQLSVTLALYKGMRLPPSLPDRENVTVVDLPRMFLQAERQLTALSRQHADVFISPYPKLPLMGCGGKAVHTIHDVLDLTHAPQRGRLKHTWDRFRLKLALQRAHLTWFVSSWSKKKTEDLFGTAGRNPKVRHNGIDRRFTPLADEADAEERRRYGLDNGYVLVIGNGKPHKNLGILLSISQQMTRTLIITGVSGRWKDYWMRKYPTASVVWIEYAEDEVIPALIRGAFCLAMPSVEEGFGYPPLEAMACGIPSVVSRIPVLMETTGGNALTADPHNTDEWLEALRVLEEHRHYERWVKKGLAWAGKIQGIDGWRGHVEDIAGLIRGCQN